MNTMKVKQTLACGLHSPKKWQDDYNGGSAENKHNLPYAAPTSIYAVDEYPACPDNWEHGSDIAGSFFAGLHEDWALWLDFNECFNHTHDVAVVLSVQGINPITGQTMVGDNPLRMEQYHKNCPIHDVAFKQDYFCEECGFKWPGQNYMSTTGTPFGMFWLDGFRTPDGNVRQYIISAEKMRSVAAQVMEKRGEDPDNRVFAIGMAFYLSKAKKPDMPDRKPVGQTGGSFTTPQAYGPIIGTQPMFFSPLHTPQNWNVKGKAFAPNNMYRNAGMMGGSSISSSSGSSSSAGSVQGQGVNISAAFSSSSVQPPDIVDSRYDRTVYQLSPNLTDEQLAEVEQAEKEGKNVERFYTLNKGVTSVEIREAEMALSAMDIEPVTPVKKLEVGAGALVSQVVYDDPKNLKKYWEETPAGMIYLNYCDEETLKKILDAGKVASKTDGFMQGVKVGG